MANFCYHKWCQCSIVEVIVAQSGLKVSVTSITNGALYCLSEHAEVTYFTTCHELCAIKNFSNCKVLLFIQPGNMCGLSK